MDIQSPASPPTTCPDAVAMPAERTGRHLRMLAELAEIGMELARDVRRQALDEPRPAPADAGRGLDFGLVFARIARAVRQTVALEAKLAADADLREQQGTAALASRAAGERKRAKQQKERVRRLIEDTISTGAEGHDAENLRFDLAERLEDPDVEAELGWRPIGVVVVGICGDLGISVDLSQFTDAELGFDLAPAGPGGARPDSLGKADRGCSGDATSAGTEDMDGGDESGQGGDGLPRIGVGIGTGRDPP